MLARPSLDLSARQRLCLTPQLRQALQVLRYSMPELERELARVLAENPWLEPASAPDVDPSQLPPESWSSLEGEGVGVDSASSPADDYSDSEWQSADAPAPGPSLREHLLEQLRLVRMDERERALVMLLIDELDENAYLGASLEEIARSMPEDIQVADAEWASALARLHKLEPLGVGARNLSECLLLQLAAHDDAPAGVRACAALLAGEHLQVLASGRLDGLAHKLGYAPTVLRQAHQLLLRLDPKPGRAWSRETVHWVVPEILVRRQGGGWQAYLNPTALPRLRLSQPQAVEPASEPLLGQWRQAQGLLRQLRQRYETMLKVARQVVACQQGYLDEGPRAMRPLVLRDVAQALGMHESTVSRATRHKYAQTPWGVLEMRYFFSPAVAFAASPAASPAQPSSRLSNTPQPVCATAVRALIREWVAGESAVRPLSDSCLAQRLAAAGMPVARRTVAKYREAEGIPNAFRRRACVIPQ